MQYNRVKRTCHSPLNLKPSNPRLTINIPHQPLPNDLLRRVHSPLLVIILRILIIPHPYELLVFIAACEYESCDAQYVFAGYFGGEGRGAAEFEGVCAGGDGSYEAVVEFLVEVFVAGRGDVD